MERVTEILAIMCPWKRVFSRTVKKKSITKEIYSLIRERKILVKSLRYNRDPTVLNEIRKLRNKINAKIEKAKSDYIRNILGLTKKDPKRFWRNIKSVIDGTEENIETVTFKDPVTGTDIPDSVVPNFLNDYFANISERVCDQESFLPYIGPQNIIAESKFAFMPPEQYQIMLFAEEIDVYSASGVDGINSMICKCLLLHIPAKFRLLYANSMFIGYFPFKWTLSRVKLIPKAGDRSNPGNWRPISMTNIFSKILEKLVHSQILKYFRDNDLLSEYQFGFLPGKSTHEAIFKVTQTIYSAINAKKLTGMLLLDIAKAFNCIDHEILFAKMSTAGFDATVIQWFRSYLHRTQQVSIQNRLSEVVAVSKGIAQGTVLGPILFIFYINDIFKCTRFVKMSLFADDCIMYLSGNNWNNLHQNMQADFDAIIDRTRRNNLRLNVSKKNAIIFGNRHCLSKLKDPKKICMSGKHVKFVQSQAYLGIILDTTMSMVPQMKSVKKRLNNKVYMLKKIRKYLTFDAAVIVYKQTILPIIDYSRFLLLSCNQGDIEELQVIQNDILRICNMTRISDKVPIPELHRKCKIIGLKQRMQKQLLWLMYIISQENSYLYVPVRQTRNAQKVIFKTPARILPIYERSPYYIGTKLWNELDVDTQKVDNVFAYKTKIAMSYVRYEPL